MIFQAEGDYFNTLLNISQDEDRGLHFLRKCYFAIPNTKNGLRDI